MFNVDKITDREKAIICGLFLSKFDEMGLKTLGFTNFKEAFNALGFSISVRSASLKNYRDEFDPFFPNIRQGWHNRVMRQNCKNIYDKLYGLDLSDFLRIMKLIIYKNPDIDILNEEAEEYIEDVDNSFAKRLITGQAAEKYFLKNYRDQECFSDSEIVDVTQNGCGFDFKVMTKHQPDFLAVEVKGLRTMSGVIALTNKEFKVASLLKKRYFIYVVKNFDEEPSSTIYKNPIETGLQFEKNERTVKQITWSVKV